MPMIVTVLGKSSQINCHITEFNSGQLANLSFSYMCLQFNWLGQVASLPC